jgi:thymidine phosphorylase
MLALAGTVRTMGEGADVLEQVRRSGRGMEHCRRWIGAQGGDPRVLVDPERLEVSELTRTVRADRAGYVRDIDALLAGNLCVQLGGGRRRMGEEIDTRVGLLLHRKRGDRVEPGDPLFTLYLPAGAPADQLVEGEDALYVIGDEAPEARELVAKLITPRGSPADPWNAPVADACRSVVRGGR